MRLINGAINSVNAAALLLGAAGLLSRLLGVLRDRLLAGTFGAGRELDAYYAAFQIPDFMNVLFLLGGAGAAVLPIFQEHLARDRKEAHRLISDITTLFFAGAIVIAGITFLLVPVILTFTVPGFMGEERALTAMLTRLMLVSPIIFGISNILSAVVQSFKRFWAYALAPVLYNLGIILGIIAFVPLFGVVGLAGGVIAGALFHLGIQLWTVRQLGFAPQLIFRGLTNGVKQVARLSFPRVLSISLSQLTLLLIIAIGSTLEQGSIAIFQLAQNLYYLPIGVFGISYAVAIFPRMSQSYIRRDGQEFFRELFTGIRSILFWLAPATVLFIVLRAHIVRVALGAGAFSWEDTRLTAAVLAVFALSLFTGGLVTFFIKGFYALENTWRPLVINIFASGLSLALALLFVQLLRTPSALIAQIAVLLRVADLTDIRVVGLAAGFSLGSIINTWLLFRALHGLAVRRFNKCQFFPTGEFFKIISSSLLAGGAAYFVRVSFAQTLPLITFSRVLAQGFIAGAVGLAVYFGLLLILKEETVYALFATIRRQLIGIKALPQSWDGEIHGPQPHQH